MTCIKLIKSNRKRALKKQWKKNGMLPVKYIGRSNGLYQYTAVLPEGI